MFWITNLRPYAWNDKLGSHNHGGSSMIRAVVARTPILVFILTFVALGYTVAHNKVVVVPMGADAGVSGYEVVTSHTGALLQADGGMIHEVACPNGKRALGGGARNSVIGVVLVDSYPVDSSTWFVTVINHRTEQVLNTLTVYAICADVIS